MLAIAGSGLSQKCKDTLGSLGTEILILEDNPNLEARVAHHADLSVLPLGDVLFTHKDTLSNRLISEAEQRGYEIRVIPEKLQKDYPNDILLNCLVVGKYIFARVGKVSKAVIEYATENGYTVINVNQGYARCTACPVSDSAVITADSSIKKAALSQGLDVLEICEGHVELNGFPYGFMGGACGVCGDKLLFAGDLKRHPDGERIAKFCKRHGITALSLSDENLCDVGSIFFI